MAASGLEIAVEPAGGPGPVGPPVNWPAAVASSWPHLSVGVGSSDRDGSNGWHILRRRRRCHDLHRDSPSLVGVAHHCRPVMETRVETVDSGKAAAAQPPQWHQSLPSSMLPMTMSCSPNQTTTMRCDLIDLMILTYY